MRSRTPRSPLRLALGASALAACTLAQATSNNGDPADWRVGAGQTFNGVDFSGVGRVSYENANGSYICSGTLLAGGAYVLTAAHCAENFTSMVVEFGVHDDVAAVTRTVTDATVHPSWTGFNTSSTLGIDLAIVKLDTPVTTIQGFKLATTNSVGSNILIMGYGTTGQGNGSADTDWNDWGWAHWGENTIDVTSATLLNGFYGAGNGSSTLGDEYVVDFDSGSAANNTLQIIANASGGGWTSSTGLGTNEALIAGGDSGGGDFVWTGNEWLLTGVHSWGWQACTDEPSLGSCDYSSTNDSSWGDLSGSVAVFRQLAWIDSVTAVPEPATWGLMALGLAGVLGAARRRGR